MIHVDSNSNISCCLKTIFVVVAVVAFKENVCYATDAYAIDAYSTNNIEMLQKSRLINYAQASTLSTSCMLACTAGFEHFLCAADNSSHLKCSLCGLELSALQPSHSPKVWHYVLSPRCPFFRENGEPDDSFLDTGVLSLSGGSLSPLSTSDTRHITPARSLGDTVTIQPDPTSDELSQEDDHANDGSATSLLEVYRRHSALR